MSIGSLKIPTPQTQDRKPKPSVLFNQLTMVQFTIDNATMPIPNPKSNIANPQARPRVPFGPFVTDVRDVSNVRGVSDVSGVRGVSVVRDVSDVSNVSNVSVVSANVRCRKKNRMPSNSESRVGGPRVSKGLSPNAIFGILESRDSKLDPVSPVSGVSGVSCVSSLSSVSNVSDAHTLRKK